jgi:hypothetical protein
MRCVNEMEKEKITEDKTEKIIGKIIKLIMALVVIATLLWILFLTYLPIKGLIWLLKK